MIFKNLTYIIKIYNPKKFILLVFIINFPKIDFY